MRTGTGIRLLLLVGLLAAPAAAATPAGWHPLLEPEALAAMLAQFPEVRIVQVSGDFARGHIPGALSADYAQWRGPPENPGLMPPLEQLGGLLRGLGIDAATPVVVIHEGSNAADMGSATRVYWTLKSLGVLDVAVLNGGLAGWRRAGLPLTLETAMPTPSAYAPRWDSRWRVTTAELERMVEEGGARLVDARPALFFKGFRATLGRPGTIRGATNLEYGAWFDGDRLQSLPSLAATLGELASGPAPVTVSFCNTGHWASINWFVMSELLGVAGTRLYAESVAEWSRLDRPMDNQPNRAAVYRELTLRWWHDLVGD